MYTVLVTGDRNWTNYERIARELDAVMHERNAAVLIIHGAATGADSLARQWSDRNYHYYDGYQDSKEYPANWRKYGRAAGPIRNQQMLEEGKPDFVLAFHNNIANSKGTKDMVARARKANIPVKICTETN
jgi:hypothetical protein